MTTKAYKQRIKLSKAQIDSEMRAVVRKIAHHSVADIVETIRQRMNVAADPEYVAQLRREFS